MNRKTICREEKNVRHGIDTQLNHQTFHLDTFAYSCDVGIILPVFLTRGHFWALVRV
jgi:hypothetical protein